MSAAHLQFSSSLEICHIKESVLTAPGLIGPVILNISGSIKGEKCSWLKVIVHIYACSLTGGKTFIFPIAE